MFSVERGDSSRSSREKEFRARADSAFVAVRALLGFEVLRRHAKHVVALDANAMQDAFGVARRRAFMGGFRLRLGRFAHNAILTQASSAPRYARSFNERAANNARTFNCAGCKYSPHPDGRVGIRSLAVGIFTARRCAIVGNPSGRNCVAASSARTFYLSGLQVEPAPGMAPAQKFWQQDWGATLLECDNLPEGTDRLRHAWL